MGLVLLAFPVLCVPFASYGLIGVLMMVQAHARVQIYLLYLERGGTPLRIEPDPPEGAFPVVVSQEGIPSRENRGV